MAHVLLHLLLLCTPQKLTATHNHTVLFTGVPDERSIRQPYTWHTYLCYNRHWNISSAPFIPPHSAVHLLPPLPHSENSFSPFSSFSSSSFFSSPRSGMTTLPYTRQMFFFNVYKLRRYTTTFVCHIAYYVVIHIFHRGTSIVLTMQWVRRVFLGLPSSLLMILIPSMGKSEKSQ